MWHSWCPQCWWARDVKILISEILFSQTGWYIHSITQPSMLWPWKHTGYYSMPLSYPLERIIDILIMVKYEVWIITTAHDCFLNSHHFMCFSKSITMNTHTLVCFDSTPNTPSCCWKYPLQNKKHNKKKLQWSVFWNSWAFFIFFFIFFDRCVLYMFISEFGLSVKVTETIVMW